MASRLFAATIFAFLCACQPQAQVLPLKDNSEQKSSKIKCSELGRKFSTEFKKEYASEVSIWENPEFHYSSASGRCMVYTEVVDGLLDKGITSVWYYRRITDIYSNEVLAYSRYFIRKNDPSKKEMLVD